MEDVDKFMRRVALFKEWFGAEELEVDDFVIGRFASRLGALEAAQKESLRKEIESKRQYCHQDNFLAFGEKCAKCAENHRLNVILSDILDSLNKV